MMDWFNSIIALAMNTVNQGDIRALIALFLVSTLTEVGIPFPFVIDAVLVAASIQNGLWSLAVFRIVLALLLGRQSGAAVIFWLSSFMGNRFVNWLCKRFPKLLNGMTWLKNKLSQRAPLAVAVVRLTPGLLTSASIAAGIMRMPYYKFVLGIVIASAVADGSLLLLGFLSGFGFKLFGVTLRPWMLVVVAIIVISVVWLLHRYWLKRQAHKTAKQINQD